MLDRHGEGLSIRTDMDLPSYVGAAELCSFCSMCVVHIPSALPTDVIAQNCLLLPRFFLASRAAAYIGILTARLVLAANIRAFNFSAEGFGQLVDKLNNARILIGRGLLLDIALQLFHQFR